MTPDLERALRELDVDWPATPDLAAAVATRIAAEPRPARAGRAWRRRDRADGLSPAPGSPAAAGSSPAASGSPAAAARPRPPLLARPRRRVAAVVAAFLLVLAGGTLAVPEARSTVFRWLGIESVDIRRGEPSATPGAGLDLGRPTTIERLTAPVLQARDLGTPGVYETTLPDGTLAASLVYDGPVLVQTFRAQASPFIEKTVGAGARAQRLDVDGATAFWIAGAHGFAYQSASGFGFEEQRIAGNTLLVDRRDGRLLRIEGARLTREEAVALARSVQ